MNLCTVFVILFSKSGFPKTNVWLTLSLHLSRTIPAEFTGYGHLSVQRTVLLQGYMMVSESLCSHMRAGEARVCCVSHAKCYRTVAHRTGVLSPGAEPTFVCSHNARLPGDLHGQYITSSIRSNNTAATLF